MNELACTTAPCHGCPRCVPQAFSLSLRGFNPHDPVPEPRTFQLFVTKHSERMWDATILYGTDQRYGSAFDALSESDAVALACVELARRLFAQSGREGLADAVEALIARYEEGIASTEVGELSCVGGPGD